MRHTWLPPTQSPFVRIVSAAILALVALAVGRAAGQEPAASRLDARTLSNIARDVLQDAAAARSEPESTAPGAEGVGQPDPPAATASEVAPALSHIAPPREGATVAIPPNAAAAPGAKKASPDKPASMYQSNSWRQARPEAERALSFSSGTLAPSSGVDPAIRAHASAVRAKGAASVYGFVRLRVAAGGAIDKKLAALGVKMLGPHDSHQKVSVPVGAIDAVAALPEVAWLGVSPASQKLSTELSGLRAPGAAALAADAPVPIVVNLFEADTTGRFKKELEAAGAAIGEYDASLAFYRAVATAAVIEQIAGLDFVLFVEMIRPTTPGHDQSTPLIDADLLRPGGAFLPRFGGSATTVGILDTGFMVGTSSPVAHSDLNKFGCGDNFTGDGTSVWNDQNGHGTHVLTTISGTGTGNIRYRGVATGVGSTPNRIRAAKIWGATGSGSTAAMENGMDFMSDASHCDSGPPQVINISGGSTGTGLTGTDSSSRKLDDKVWTNRQSYVVCSGNSGPGAQTIWSPGVAKSALTVGNVLDNGYLTVGDLNNGSSRGPTGDGRMKPNIVGPGTVVTSAQAGTTNGYVGFVGCSMATPHVTGLAATLMEHYPEFRDHPALLRAHMMASSIAHDDVTGRSNLYGIGRVSGFLEHWAQSDPTGWSTNWFWGNVSSAGFGSGDITVPPGTQRLVVVMTWDEPPASAGASRAVTYDLDLWVDQEPFCTSATGACGDFASVSSVDNVEYVVWNNPPAGNYRLKVTPFNAPSFSLRYGIAAMIIRGDPTPPLNAFLSAPAESLVGSTFTVQATVSAPSYVGSGVQVEPTLIPLGVTLLDVQTPRFDGVTMSFLGVTDALTLGNVTAGLPRTATWTVRADTTGPKLFKIRAWSENGGEVVATRTVQVVPPRADLIETALTLNPTAPVRAPGQTFAVTDTALNAGAARADASTTRYYLSLDTLKSTNDILLTGTHSVHGMDPGASHTATVNVTIPTTTPPGSYFVLACADDKATVDESNETNNCLASTTAAVTVARPDLAGTSVTANPASPVRAPGQTFAVTDALQNRGLAASNPSTLRYYLSLDPVKNAGDVLLTGSRAVPGLAPNATNTGTATVTIPPTAPLAAYYVLACADDLNAVVETDETNNCVASAGVIVTVTRPDLLETVVSAAPATKQRGTAFPMTDTVQNAGGVASGVSSTRYYLSLDAVKSPTDILLNGARSIPALPPGASHSGPVTLTIPANTAPNTYFVLACADASSAVIETNETNNCKAAPATMVVTP